MELLVNDLSFQGQFPDIASFRSAIGRILSIRQVSLRFDRPLFCHRNVCNAQVTPTMNMSQAVEHLPRDERRALMQWLTQHGPFWEDVRNHGPDDWFEYSGNIVTDSAVGEAAWCCLNGIERRLASLVPSGWQISPLPVDQVVGCGSRNTVDVLNYWDADILEGVLRVVQPPPVSWEQVVGIAAVRCSRLLFLDDAFVPLNGCPFSSSAAQRLLFILDTLDRFKSCFDEDGRRTREGHEMYQNFFTGQKGGGGHGALFSDSSESEKHVFRTAMTFRHPTIPAGTLFCPWHGKVQTPQLRVHFSWPIYADDPLYVAYVGPKITVR